MSTETRFVIGSIVIGIFLLFGTSLEQQATGQSGGGNVSVLVNVTNTPPAVIDVHVYDAADPFTDESIDLNANGQKEVICNATASDLNGQADIINATARLYSTIVSGFDSAADNNNHYRNTSCLERYNIASAANNASVICRFNVQYYANNESWECNINVSDNGGSAVEEPGHPPFYFSDNSSDDVLINELLAMTVPIQEVDFGNLSATETSDEAIINVTNAGNIVTNFSVRGFGGNGTQESDAESRFANLSMTCETGNITIGNLRYSNTTGAAWADMINLTGNATQVKNVTLEQRSDDNAPQFGQDLNLTYWRILIPTGVAGLCNGTIAFQAVTVI